MHCNSKNACPAESSSGSPPTHPTYASACCDPAHMSCTHATPHAGQCSRGVCCTSHSTQTCRTSPIHTHQLLSDQAWQQQTPPNTLAHLKQPQLHTTCLHTMHAQNAHFMHAPKAHLTAHCAYSSLPLPTSVDYTYTRPFRPAQYSSGSAQEAPPAFVSLPHDTAAQAVSR